MSRSHSMTGAVVAGAPIRGEASVEVLEQTDVMMLSVVRMKRGFVHEHHHHPEHQSVGYVVAGRLRMTVGDVTRDLVPGSTFSHALGVYHETHALEDSTVVETHTPPRADYGELPA
jgi:quercetin dioxygenase-like cupin family protein